MRQLSRLAHERETEAETVGDRGADDEAARLDAEDDVDAVAVVIGDAVDDVAAAPAPDASSGVMSLKTMPGFGKVTDVADVGLQLVEGHVASSFVRLAVCFAAVSLGRK